MELQSRFEELQGLGVVAISYDSEEVLADFSRRRAITFPLLSDDDSSVITAFGILNTVAAEALAELDALTLSGTLDYQACDDELCFDPVSVPLSFTLELDLLDRQRAEH